MHQALLLVAAAVREGSSRRNNHRVDQAGGGLFPFGWVGIRLCLNIICIYSIKARARVLEEVLAECGEPEIFLQVILVGFGSFW